MDPQRALSATPPSSMVLRRISASASQAEAPSPHPTPQGAPNSSPAMASPSVKRGGTPMGATSAAPSATVPEDLPTRHQLGNGPVGRKAWRDALPALRAVPLDTAREKRRAKALRAAVESRRRIRLDRLRRPSKSSAYSVWSGICVPASVMDAEVISFLWPSDVARLARTCRSARRVYFDLATDMRDRMAKSTEKFGRGTRVLRIEGEQAAGIWRLDGARASRDFTRAPDAWSLEPDTTAPFTYPLWRPVCVARHPVRVVRSILNGASILCVRDDEDMPKGAEVLLRSWLWSDPGFGLSFLQLDSGLSNAELEALSLSQLWVHAATCVQPVVKPQKENRWPSPLLIC